MQNAICLQCLMKYILCAPFATDMHLVQNSKTGTLFLIVTALSRLLNLFWRVAGMNIN